MNWYKVADIQYTKAPFIKKVKVNSKSLCLVGYDGDVFAVSSTCPHAGGELAGGWCTNGKVICPLHRYAYDIKTGRGDPGQNDYIDTYAVEIRGDDIYVGMLSLRDKLKQIFK